MQKVRDSNMEHVIKIAGCAILALLCVAVPMLTVLSLVYQWIAPLSICLIALSLAIVCIIFFALMNVE